MGTSPDRADRVHTSGMVTFSRIDHVQVSIPAGGEADARRFWVDLCGMVEVPKPPALAARGGCWFEAGEVQIHVGVEGDFRPAKKAHPALRVVDYDALLARLASAGVAARPNDEVPGVRRCFVDDPFGNRVELVADDAPQPAPPLRRRAPLPKATSVTPACSARLRGAQALG